MSSLSPESRAIIDAARPGEGLATGDRERMKRKLMIATGVAAAGAATATKATAAVATKVAASKAAEAGAAVTAASIPMVSSVGVLTKIGATALLLGGLGVGAQQWMADDTASPSPSAATTTTPVAVSSALTPPTRHEPTSANTQADDTNTQEPARTVTSSRPARAPAPQARSAKPSASSIAAETELLQQAQGQLTSGDPDKALELLDQHEAEHKSGALREERQAARVLALCRAGRADEARAAASRFSAEFPRSPHRARVASACATP